MADILKFKKKGSSKGTVTSTPKGLSYQRTKEEILQDELKYDKDFNEFNYFGAFKYVKQMNTEPLYTHKYTPLIKQDYQSHFYNYSWELMMLEIPITFNRVRLPKKKLDKLLKELKAVQIHSKNISNMMNDLLDPSKDASKKHHVGINANMRQESLKLISDKYVFTSLDAETLSNIIKDDEKNAKATKPETVKHILYLVLLIEEIRKTVLTKLDRFGFARDIIDGIEWLGDVSDESLHEAIKVSKKKSFLFQDLMNLSLKDNEKAYFLKRDKILNY
ncbi:hypothetical protein N9W51_00125 [Alphaproteobacteria bacterium]|nr:hypothetical protein [Alphaproteobacteria bacterium]